eukprot:6471685-Amphidinium_carterae.1
MASLSNLSCAPLRHGPFRTFATCLNSRRSGFRPATDAHVVQTWPSLWTHVLADVECVLLLEQSPPQVKGFMAAVAIGDCQHMSGRGHGSTLPRSECSQRMLCYKLLECDVHAGQLPV